MARQYPGSFEGHPHYRWVKMIKGVRYRVNCTEGENSDTVRYLNLPRDQWTKADSYMAAKEAFDQMIGAAVKEAGERTKLKAAQKELVETGQTDISIVMDQPRPRRTSKSIDAAIDEFLEQKSDKKAKTYKELQRFLNLLRVWWADLQACEINEERVTAAHKKIKECGLSDDTKKKQWGTFRRFVRFLYEEAMLDNLPRNLGRKDYAFTIRPKAVKVFELGLVREVLAGLPDKLQCFALLGLNCGMTNVDIGALTHDQVNGWLKRKRVKTEDWEDVPVVKYQLWPETLKMLQACRSDHKTLWFTSSHGTALVEHRIVDGKVKEKDLIGLAWHRNEAENGHVPIRLKDFRSIAATTLEKHPVYGRYVSYFLGHSPKSLKDKHYAAPSQEIFDEALVWLRGQIVG